MDKKLQDKLYRKYPDLFKQKDLSAEETCMCEGITTPDYWYDILDTMCLILDKHSKEKKIDLQFTQVKEKFGTLRAYVNYEDNLIRCAIRVAESMTECVCAQCGSEKNVQETVTNMWVNYACEKCRKKSGRRKELSFQ